MHNENLNRNKVRLISFVSFLVGFLDAFFIYILSSYFSLLSNNHSVGVFYFVAYAGVLFSLFYLQPLVRLIGRSRALYLPLGMSICAASVLASASATWMLLGAALVLIIASNVIWVTLDILLEGFSQDRFSGSIRGLYLTIMNAGLLSAPFLSLKTLERFDFSGIFLLLVIGYTIVFLIALIGFRSDNRVFQEKLRLRATVKKMFAHRNLLHIYHVSFAMEFFYAMMIVYTPLYLRSLGYSWDDMGILFTIMLLPFVIFQYPLGILADRYFGEKEMLFGSLSIATLSTAALPFLGGKEIIIWGVMLFLTRVGIAGIEILRDSYFYKQIDGNDMDIIAFFRTARPLANMIGALLSVLMFIYFPLSSVFFLVALVLFCALMQVIFLEDTKSVREI